ncbi:hypothetical protein DBV05_g10042 [Lasiodiplodia theobromae]|uniref:Uncharacterized protein n=1 Tax=Lasiodiplodia theobromae TaxID=45133 RepID=A0A5N5D0Z1_9PEZI|nr:hypothetical protein DBV05_g10042 [Lasiodiplodia theobromae]
MKFNIGIILAAASFTRVFSTAVPDDAAAECGSLGVMSLEDVPEDALAGEVRKCADHPLGNNRPFGGTSLAPLDDSDDFDDSDDSGNSTDVSADASGLQARDCWYGSEYGCTDGYCWKTCGDGGRWCWTANNGGNGPWRTCASWRDCKKKFDCGKNCKSCGCSC